MKEITFVYPTSKLTRTIKVCETQKELINVIRERRALKNGYVYVIYKNGGYFYQLFGSSGYKVNHFKRYGIMSATVSSSSSGELFVFGDFAITPNDRVCIGKAVISKYGPYSGQYDVKPEKVETDTNETDTDEVTIDEIRQAYNNAIDDAKHNLFYCIDEECRQAVIYSKFKQLDFINDLWRAGFVLDYDGFFSRKVNSYIRKTGDLGITTKPYPYYTCIRSNCQSTIRFALYLLGR